MPTETATYIDDLDVTKPGNAEDASEGAAHLRLLKATIKATFPNVDAAVTATDTEINSWEERVSDLEGETLKADGTVAMTAALNLNGFKVTSLAQPVADSDAARWVDVKLLYPVGHVLINATSSTNPASYLGFGTWEALGAGRVLIGVGTGTDANSEAKAFAAGATGGEYNHTLTDAEMPSHDHTYTRVVGGLGGEDVGSGATYGRISSASGSAGSDDPHNNIQPYLAVYMWKRTA